ncbi:lactadherin-like [Ptychodera flava]|uniref:lactadherin-like n=1 Tax=Ptychodera flava TaxID=63121 RepID=UPI00396A690A
MATWVPIRLDLPYHYTSTQGSSFIDNVTSLIQDPDGGSVTYSNISGSLPDGVTLDTNSGRLYGIAPSIDASFSFGIRALDQHGTYADTAFSLDIRDLTVGCEDDDYCLNGGNCSTIDDYPHSLKSCDCPSPYGGQRCEVSCVDNEIGLSNRSVVRDSQFTGYNTVDGYVPQNGRLYNSGYWRGTGNSAYLQIVFEGLYTVFAVATQGRTYGSYGVRNFRLYHSLNGDTFEYYTEYNMPRTFSNTGGNYVKKNTLASPTTMRAIRFYVVTYSGRASLRAEVYGCEVNE